MEFRQCNRSIKTLLFALQLVGLGGCATRDERHVIAKTDISESAFENYNTCLAQHMTQSSGCEPERQIYAAILKRENR